MAKQIDLNLLSKYRTALMGFAALWIFLFHEYEHEWAHIVLSPAALDFLIGFLRRIGYCGVDIFLFLSGIGLIASIEKHRLSVFYQRRLERVYLPFLLTGLIQALVLGWGISVLLKKILLFDFLFVRINSLLWFVPMILLFYLFFPLYYRGLRHFSDKWLFTLAALLVWLVLSLGLNGTLRGDLYCVTNRIPIFILGIYAGQRIHEGHTRLPGYIRFLLLPALFLGLYLSYLTNYRDLFLLVPVSNCCVPNLLIAPSLSLLLVYLFSLLDHCAGKILLRILSFFGGISLEIYCMQEWLDDLLRPRLTISQEYWMQHAWYVNLRIFLCVLAAAYALHWACRLLLRLRCRLFPET